MKEDPRNLHCTITWRGRELLGEIIGFHFSQVRGITLLTVRHFCGDLWPIEPAASAVIILQ